MSTLVNEEIKFIWKTNDKWRDHEDFAERKNIRPKNMSWKEDFEKVPLKPGDAVKIKFNKKWYDGEVMESWNADGSVTVDKSEGMLKFENKLERLKPEIIGLLSELLSIYFQWGIAGNRKYSVYAPILE